MIKTCGQAILSLSTLQHCPQLPPWSAGAGVSWVSWTVTSGCHENTSFLMQHSLQLWDSLMSPILPLLPITNNLLLPPGLDQPQSFSWWTFPGFMHVLTFPVRQVFTDVPQSEVFRHLQLRHWLSSLCPTSTYPFWKNALEHTWQHSPGSPSLISTLYTSLNSRPPSTPLSYVTQWERDLASEIDLADWSRAWSSVTKCSF